MPTGANTNIYFILVSNGDDIEPIFYTIGRGLEVGNIDYDQEKELISVLEGYFYDWKDNQLHLIETVLSTNVRQLVWEGDESGLVVYFANGISQSGRIDTLNLQLNYNK